MLEMNFFHSEYLNHSSFSSLLSMYILLIISACQMLPKHDEVVETQLPKKRWRF